MKTERKEDERGRKRESRIWALGHLGARCPVEFLAISVLDLNELS